MPKPSSLEPIRPLGAAGLQCWNKHAPQMSDDERDKLLMLCEQIDERMILRVSVLRTNDPEQRRALRQLDQHINNGLTELAARTDRSKIRTRQQELEWLRNSLAAAFNNEPDGAKRALISREYRRVLEILQTEFPIQTTTKVDELAARRTDRNTVTSNRASARSSKPPRSS
jgi:hypothetical protein